MSDPSKTPDIFEFSSGSATEADAFQVSYNGSNTGETGMIGSGKSVLIGQNLSGANGDSNVAAGEFNYRAKTLRFQRSVESACEDVICASIDKICANESRSATAALLLAA